LIPACLYVLPFRSWIWIGCGVLFEVQEADRSSVAGWCAGYDAEYVEGCGIGYGNEQAAPDRGGFFIRRGHEIKDYFLDLTLATFFCNGSMFGKDKGILMFLKPIFTSRSFAN